MIVVITGKDDFIVFTSVSIRDLIGPMKFLFGEITFSFFSVY